MAPSETRYAFLGHFKKALRLSCVIGIVVSVGAYGHRWSAHRSLATSLSRLSSPSERRPSHSRLIAGLGPKLPRYWWSKLTNSPPGSRGSCARGFWVQRWVQLEEQEHDSLCSYAKPNKPVRVFWIDFSG